MLARHGVPHRHGRPTRLDERKLTWHAVYFTASSLDGYIVDDGEQPGLADLP